MPSTREDTGFNLKSRFIGGLKHHRKKLYIGTEKDKILLRKLYNKSQYEIVVKKEVNNNEKPIQND